MMSLVETRFLSLVKKQFIYKWKTNTSFIISMIIVQMLALCLSFNGVMTSGTGNQWLSFTYSTLTGDMIIIFTMIWCLIIAGTLATANRRNIDFYHVSNRLTSNLANTLFLLTTSIVSGISTVLGSVLLRVLFYAIHGTQFLSEGEAFSLPPRYLMLGIIVTATYLWLLSAIGYLFGAIIQFYRIFAIIIPAVIIGSLFYFNTVGITVAGDEHVSFIRQLWNFYTSESTLWLFMLKSLLTTGLLFAVTALMTNRMEVRK
ncbi:MULTISPECIES: hypothetical protein [Dehalobacter]|uniref:hypothetical protein n=1 Tax=Dehalobacter TaxID=56112 RepID=UPI0025871A30|nr:hypothetical protein [Dehalobacter sp.]MDJ0305815.1 hypothetical protein [Dehalobacter sp.]